MRNRRPERPVLGALRVDVDPAFDVMRRLDPLEVPPAVSTLLGRGDAVFVLPATAPAAEREAWTALATAWAKPNAPTLITDEDPAAVPAGTIECDVPEPPVGVIAGRSPGCWGRSAAEPAAVAAVGGAGAAVTWIVMVSV